MKTALLCITCYLTGVFSVGVPLLMLLTHRPRYIAPTLRRKNRDAPERHLFEELKSGVEELEAGRQDEDRVRYQFMGTTGFEE